MNVSLGLEALLGLDSFRVILSWPGIIFSLSWVFQGFGLRLGRSFSWIQLALDGYFLFSLFFHMHLHMRLDNLSEL